MFVFLYGSVSVCECICENVCRFVLSGREVFEIQSPTHETALQKVGTTLTAISGCTGKQSDLKGTGVYFLYWTPVGKRSYKIVPVIIIIN